MRTNRNRIRRHAARFALWAGLCVSAAGCGGESSTTPQAAPASDHPLLGVHTGDREEFLYVERDFDPARIVIERYEKGLLMHVEVFDGPVMVDFSDIYLSQHGIDFSVGDYRAAQPVTRGWRSPVRQTLERGSYEALIDFAAFPQHFCGCESFELLWGPYRVRF